MKLINIKGDTYYIKGGTNTGVVKLDEDNVLIIDPGLGGLRPKKIMGLLKENNMKIYEVEERTPLVAPLLNIWEEIWYSKLWNPGSYSQRAESAGSWIL